MTAQEALKLKKWDKVIWDYNQSDVGIVESINEHCITIYWMKTHERGYTHPDDMQRIELALDN